MWKRNVSFLLSIKCGRSVIGYLLAWRLFSNFGKFSLRLRNKPLVAHRLKHLATYSGVKLVRYHSSALMPAAHQLQHFVSKQPFLLRYNFFIVFQVVCETNNNFPSYLIKIYEFDTFCWEEIRRSFI